MMVNRLAALLVFRPRPHPRPRLLPGGWPYYPSALVSLLTQRRFSG